MKIRNAVENTSIFFSFPEANLKKKMSCCITKAELLIEAHSALQITLVNSFIRKVDTIFPSKVTQGFWTNFHKRCFLDEEETNVFLEKLCHNFCLENSINFSYKSFKIEGNWTYFIYLRHLWCHSNFKDIIRMFFREKPCRNLW